MYWRAGGYYHGGGGGHCWVLNGVNLRVDGSSAVYYCALRKRLLVEVVIVSPAEKISKILDWHDRLFCENSVPISSSKEIKVRICLCWLVESCPFSVDSIEKVVCKVCASVKPNLAVGSRPIPRATGHVHVH